MPPPGSHRVARLVIVAGLAAAITAAPFPPVLGERVPLTVIRSASVDVAELVPRTDRGIRATRGGLRAGRPSWTARTTSCAPIRFTMVGITWRQDGDGTVPVDVSHGGRRQLSEPIRVQADPDEGPDLEGPEDTGLHGTPPIWTGEARCIAFRLRLPEGEALRGLRLHFLNTSGTAFGRPPPPGPGEHAWDAVGAALGGTPADAVVAKPSIIRRKEWGADERLRNCGPDYASKLKMAYVHHTVHANNYTRSESDDLIRGIYAYHTNSKGWCDIAYNFLIDRFGRIFEGRFGGMTKPVIGGHAQGFNTGSTGVAAIATYTKARPPVAVIRAFKHVLAWRLDHAYLKPTGWATMVSGGGSNQKFQAGEKVRLRVISGHRDTGFTECPGEELYRRLGGIRKGALRRGLPKIWNPRQSRNGLRPGQQTVRYRAGLSGTLSWKINFRNPDGVVVHTLRGTGGRIDTTWDGMVGAVPAAPGTYTAVIRARDGNDRTARAARLTLRIRPIA
jgi:hypothetical protein